jgi:uncharacterized protein
MISICRENDINYIGLFGSMARGDANAQSDIDLLIRFDRQKSLLSVVRLERELSDAMGRKVDLITESSLNPHLREDIFQDLQVLYEA